MPFDASEYIRNRRATRKAAGLCVACGSAARLPGKPKCERCRDSGRAYFAARIAKLRAAGKCRYCVTGDIVPGKAACRECLDYNAMRYRNNKKACGECDGPLVLTCHACFAKSQERAQ